MSKIKYATNSKFTTPWAQRVGKLILNFAGLEFESYNWFIQLTEKPELIPKFTLKTFKNRADKIIELANERAFNRQWRYDVAEGWTDAIELAKLRNRLAHNPLVFGWIDKTEKGEPDFIGFPDMRSRTPKSVGEPHFISKMDIDGAINQIAKIVPHLNSLLHQWCELRDDKQNDRNSVSAT